jgi:type I restriction enzyme S subunit
MREISFAIPSLPEQAAIVRFLDHADRRIRRYIRAKQRLITLLEEQKQAIIHRAVTRGLDPNVRLKPSGVEWLGDVPEHWEVRPLKNCIRLGTSISYGIVQPGEHTSEGVPFVQTGNLTKQEFAADALQRTTREIAARYPRSVITTGDVLLGIRASVGAAAVAPPSLNGANLSRGIARIALGASLKSEFLTLYLRSRTTQVFWTAFQQGTTFNEIPIALVRTLPVLVPPVEEQRRIVTWVREQVRLPDHAAESARREIGLLNEYRTRLIADVVTGKLDVRDAAARLSNEPEGHDQFDDPGADGPVANVGADEVDNVWEDAEV